jgi:3-isopropylmalate dehydrogenase
VKNYRIGVIPGDGIGPEVIREGMNVLACLADMHGFTFDAVTYPWSSQLYLDTGRLMSDLDLKEFRKLDAIYLGALGDPRVERGLVERSVIMTLRLGLDLYVNVRPIVLMAEHLSPLKNVRPEDVDMLVIRENTEDCYVGVGGSVRLGTADEVAIAEMVYTRRGVERAVRYAFDRARERRKKLTLVDKSNAIRAQEIWRRTFAEVGVEYPDIATDAVYVDAAAMYMVDDPARFDVIVTTNLFGDILTDLGASIQGGLGSAASGNIHPGRVSMFEPVHGSAPDISGQNKASPIGAILALGMLLDDVGERQAAQSVHAAVRELLESRRIPSLDARSGLSTDAIGDLVTQKIEELSKQADRSSSV